MSPVPTGLVRSGPSGIASVRLFAKTVKVEFEDGKSYTIPRANTPKFLKKGGKLYVRLSSDTTRISSYRPLKGTHIVGFIGISRPRGQDINGPPIPVSKTRNWTDDMGIQRSSDYMGFTVRMQILEGDYEQTRLYGPMEYRFIEAMVDGESVAGLYGRTARAYIRLKTWLEAAGLDWEDDVIPWVPIPEGSVLPYIEELLFSRVQPFQVTLDNGWPDQYAPITQSLVKKEKTKLKALLKELAEND